MRPPDSHLPNEAAVEWHIIEPLLTRLGYAKDDVAPKHPIVFREGRKGRHPEADYAVFSGRQHGRETSLFVIEAKRPGEPGWSAKDQAESYQHALRAPFLLLVDGLTIEVWQYQPAGESELVFGPVAIADLKSHFGALSLILSKEAVIAHRDRLRGPNVRSIAEDWSPYLNAELDRLDKHGFLVARTLLDARDSSKLSTSTLVADFPRGACITAPSGYGKSSLAVAIMRQALEASLAAPSQGLPVLIPCDDLPTSVDLVNFVLQRLAAHKPGLTLDEVLRRLKAYGFTIVIDAFERLPAERRLEIAKELRNLSRDYPRLQVFLLSRRGTVSPMGQPILHLEPLSEEEQRELAATVLAPARDYAWVSAPELLRSLCRVPLLLNLALAFWRKHHAWPTGLAEMFDQWLTSIVSVGAEHSASQQASRREALRQLATRHAEGPLGVDAGIAVLKTAGHPAALFDELMSVDAIEVHASGLGFPHDALGDYLRALEWVAQSEAELALRIAALNVERGSLFPVLLLSLTTSVAAQRAMWQRLMQSDIQSYFDALRYRADGSATLLTVGQERFALNFLEEVLDGIEQPLQAFFPELAAPVLQDLAEDDAVQLAIIGNADPKEVHYGLVPKTDGRPRVRLGPPTRTTTQRYINLHLSRMRSDAGRMIGTNLLRDTINDIAKARNFRAGQALASERLYGRLRYLAGEYDLQLGDGATIEDALAEFEPQTGEYVCWPLADDDRTIFLVDEIIADLKTLRASGLPLPSAWWRLDGGAGEIDLASDAAIHYAVNEEIRRAQVIYDEIIRLNFRAIASELPIHGSLPLRYQISIKRNHKRAPDNETLWITRVSMPVADWASAGADLVPPSGAVRPTSRAYYDDVAAVLERLGRHPARVVARWSSGSIKRFDGTDWLGNFDGETAAMRTACNWLEDDLKALFEELPER
jgi:hypothetical protein